MRVLASVLIVLVLSVAVALVAQKDPGYVLISHGDWSAETSLAVFLLLEAVAFGVLYLAVRLVMGTFHLPGRLMRWRRRRQAARARRATNRGLIALAEGHWARGERELIRHAAHSETPLLNYLAAARAAQKEGAEERRDEYLRLAHKSTPQAELAIGLTQAEVQLSGGQVEQTLATLMHLRGIAPKHPHVLYLLKRLYLRLESWKDLLELLPDLRRQKVLDEAEADRLEVRALEALIRRAVRTGKAEDLRQQWTGLPKGRRHQPALVAAYAEGLLALGHGGEGEEPLREALRRHWDTRLIRLYGLVASGEPNRQLTEAEGWLTGRERQPALLLALGRLALRAELWGKARSYLEAAVGIEPTPEGYRELGELLARLGEHEAAGESFRKGLNLAAGPQPAPAAD